MNTHKRIRVFPWLVVVLAIAAIGVGLTTESASADVRCRVPLPFGGWTEGCPHYHPPAEEPSCIAVMTNTFYEFRINNSTGHTVYYGINGVNFSLSDGYGRDHRYQRAYGTNSCNVQYYNQPRIKFDYSYQSGFQERSYTVGGNRLETFKVSGNGIDLYH